MQHSLARLTMDRGRPVAVQVFEQLRDRIVSLDLPPGSALSRTALGEEFGVSSTPLRDALLRLEEEGLVDVFPQHATLVSRIDLAKVRQAALLRRSVELEVVSGLAGLPDRSFVEELRAMLARQRRLLELDAMDELSLADTGFHGRLCAAAGVEGLWGVIRRESADLDRLRKLHLPLRGKADSILTEHGALLDAIAAGDVETARATIRRHLSGTLASVDDLRARHAAFFRDDGAGPSKATG